MDKLDTARLTVVLSLFALLLLVGLVISTFVLTKVQKLEPQVVPERIFVVVTPTLAPTATPSAQFRPIGPFKPLK